MQSRTHATILVTAFTLCLASAAHAAPQSISFTGNLTDEAGAVVTPVNITARVFDGNNQLIWQESHSSVQPRDGLVFLELGSVDRANNALDTSVFDGGARFLEIEVDGDVLSPRLALLSVPYATHASYAEKTGEASFATDAGYAESAGSATSIGGLTAADLARKDHNHDGVYATAGHQHSNLLPKGGLLACTGSQKVVGLNGTTGNVICGADLDTNTTYTATGGLSLSAGQFSLASNGVTSSHIVNGTITAADIASNTIDSGNIKDGAITGTDIANGTITGADIADGTLTQGKVNGPVKLYEINDAGCDNYKMLTLTTTCTTRFNGVSYYNCNGTPGTVQQTCNNGEVGYIFKP